MPEDKEFKGSDSISHLTKHQTGGRYDITVERSEINSHEEQRWWVYNKVWARLVHPVFGVAPEAHFSGKIAKDRGSRHENVEFVHGMYTGEKKDIVRRSGLILRSAIEDMQKEEGDDQR